jgi:hypothetical protein|eukprot:COSAG01_NODE_441_length_17032_cov_27.546389_4_plen_187_part_00
MGDDGVQWNEPLLVRAAKGKPIERLPVWLMRQAGRYLPEYHEARKGPDGQTTDFFHAIRDAEMAAEITVQPVRRFGVDAAIIYSDILIIPAAMGCTVEMVPVVKGDGSKKANSVAAAEASEKTQLGPDGKPAPQSRGPMRPNFPKPLVVPAVREGSPPRPPLSPSDMASRPAPPCHLRAIWMLVTC